MRPLLGWNLIIFSLLLQPSPPNAETSTPPIQLDGAGSPPVSFIHSKAPGAQNQAPT